LKHLLVVSIVVVKEGYWNVLITLFVF